MEVPHPGFQLAGLPGIDRPDTVSGPPAGCGVSPLPEYQRRRFPMNKEWENAVRMAKRLKKAKDKRAAIRRLLGRCAAILKSEPPQKSRTENVRQFTLYVGSRSARQ
jgi:hypothetical protein